MADPFLRPSNADFLNAINAIKIANAPPPAGYQLLFSSTSDSSFASGGLGANVYANQTTGQVIVAFNGPVTVSTSSASGTGQIFDPVLAAASTEINSRIANNDSAVTNEAQLIVNDFILRVEGAALAAGYEFSSNNVFVTGNSSGGFWAQVARRAD